MEIVPIIYKFLLIGGILLTVVVVISFVLSKSAAKNETRLSAEKSVSHQPMYFDHNAHHGGFQHQPVIYPIDALSQKEVKVVRKQSYEELDSSMHQNGGNGRNGNRRYTILNEELKNSNYRYVNHG